MVRPKAAPPPPETEGEVGLKTDPGVWGSFILVVGSCGEKILSTVEHLDFLVSIREEKFKLIYEFWQSVGWWIAMGIGLVWFVMRFLSRKEKHEKAPTWGLLASCSIVSIILGGMIAVRSTSGMPNIVLNTGISWGPGISTSCAAQLDGEKLISFKDDFKVALVCAMGNPTMDPLLNTNISLSNEFVIIPGPIAIAADKQLGAIALNTPTNLTLFPVLVPKNVPREKITSLTDVLSLGGKILSPAYYK